MAADNTHDDIEQQIRRQLSAKGIDDPTEADIRLIRSVWEGVGGWEAPTEEELRARAEADLSMDRHLRRLAIERILRKTEVRKQMFADIFRPYREAARAVATGVD